MDLDVELAGASELETRLAHAQAGVLSLSRDLAAELERTTPPQLVAESPRMRPRAWGAGDVWTLPAGGWIVGRVKLPDDTDKLTDHIQQLLDD